MSKQIILQGNYNNLTILKYDRYYKGKTYWLCKCDCGKVKSIQTYYIITGHTKSCGCRKEIKVNYQYNNGELYSVDKNGKQTKLKAKTKCNGRFYLSMNENGKTKFIHRKIWEMHNGEIPKRMVIDHIDNNPLNNKIENLQCITQSENCKKNHWSKKKQPIKVAN